MTPLPNFTVEFGSKFLLDSLQIMAMLREGSFYHNLLQNLRAESKWINNCHVLTHLMKWKYASIIEQPRNEMVSSLAANNKLTTVAAFEPKIDH